MVFSTTQKLFHALLTANLIDRVNTCYHLTAHEEVGSTHGAQGTAQQSPGMSILHKGLASTFTVTSCIAS